MYKLNDTSNHMKKIYLYYCLFFVGSILPFLIVELFFQDYFACLLLATFASIVFVICCSGKIVQRLDTKEENVHAKWEPQKEETVKATIYYFSNVIR